MKPVVTDRLILRPWSEQDAPDLYEYAVDPAVGPMAGWKPHESLRESQIIIRELFIKKDDCWAVSLKDSGKVIGSVGLHEDRLRQGISSKMLGYVLSQKYWGRGIATEAARAAVAYGFEEMGLSVISVGHFPSNAKSARVIEKCGFIREGTLRSALRIYDGRVVDEVTYSITREEYFGKK